MISKKVLLTNNPHECLDFVRTLSILQTFPTLTDGMVVLLLKVISTLNGEVTSVDVTPPNEFRSICYFSVGMTITRFIIIYGR